VLAYAGAYLVGAVVSYSVLRRVLGGLETPRLARFLVRVLLAAAIATAVAWAAKYGVAQAWTHTDAKLQAVVELLVTAGVDVLVFLALARAMRITEVTGVTSLLRARLRR
jgi:putative peptidoglycan lipid II flippase